MRIAVLQFAHETVTFLPNDTTREDFIYPGSPAGGEALLATDPKGYMGGFVQVAREYGDVELIGITSPLWPRTGTGSGWITQDAYEHFLRIMIAELKAQQGLDGVYLALHGALAVRGVPRPEADIARRVREVVGRHVFISATFDPHGNEDEAFLEQADMAFTVKYFPHYDMHLQGERAARMLVRAIRGSFKPLHRTVRIPIIAPTVVMWTGASPWSDLIQRALIWEAREPDVFVNVFFGFPWSDVPDAGMGLQVLTNNDPALADRVIRDMAEWTWRRREALLNTVKIHAMKQGVALAREAVTSGKAPVVLADYSDRSGYATWLLQEIIEQRLERTLIATIASPDIIRSVLATGAKPGDAFDAEIGGLFDESAGESVRICGTIRYLSHATTARGTGNEWICVSFGKGNVLVLSPYLVQIMEPSELWQLGFKPDEFDVIAIKSRAHFRRGFDDSGFAPTILLVEPPQPFMGTVHLQALPYENLRLMDYYPYGDPSFPPADWN
ncbi:microcystin degradation protein MlrC [Bosea sp. BE125]|uniref:M81 family metallopeptidase n=1 Tax=Bosea sp. BE125 TaxID=2817909 RepID=UPI002863423F|nr:M81 family metallopeptidase [Bosea sp. BE125]MDR6874098.1 microcystin degradation protein MlrC [Bosea sp. BE125]